MNNAKTNKEFKKIFFIILIFSQIFTLADLYGNDNFHYRLAFYQDWMGFKSGDNPFYNRLSSRFKLTALSRPGDGWTLDFDLRNRTTLLEGGKSQFIIYTSKISYNSPKSAILLSFGQMNLYDTAGIGELTGGLAGIKIGKYISTGVYGGLEPDIYSSKWSTKYVKYGLFARYIGTKAKQFNLSFNNIRFDNKSERQFIYSSILFPVKNILVLYGSAEYELGSMVGSSDRLTRVFSNIRINAGKYADITGFVSRGRGLDFHEFLLSVSKNPSLQNSGIERYFYSSMYGVRLRLKPSRKINFFIERRESEMIDKQILNHTYRLGMSLSDLLGSGISMYGNYTVNRGDSSESNSFYISAAKDFNKITWSINFSNLFNGVRYYGNETPGIIHLPDTFSAGTDIFIRFNRHFAISTEYYFTYRSDYTDNQLFLRLIYRGRK